MSIEEPHTPAADPAPEGIFDKTWEIELLISGGVVFALLQLPPLLERSFLRLEPRLTDWWREASFHSFIYLKAILYTLISAFILHLASRAYWIGLIGLEKVYPGGIRWEKLQAGGPLTQRIQRETISPLRPLIARIDLFCSAIFSFAFLVVLGWLMSIVLVGLAVLLAWSLSSLLDTTLEISFLVALIIFGFSLLVTLPGMLDKLLAGRLKPGGRTERGLARALHLVHGLQLGTLFSSIFFVLYTNVRRRSFLAILLLPLGMIAFFAASHAAERKRFWQSDAPAADREIAPLHYEDQWPEEGVSRLAPSIPSDVIEGPYLKLFIPYILERHDEAFAERCPDARATLDCVARLHRVAVDGRAVPGLTFHVSTHPKSGARGFRAYIPTAGLPRGPHLLRIEPLPARERWLRRKEHPRPFLIRFWT